MKTHSNQRRKIVTATLALFCGMLAAANSAFAQTWIQTSAISNTWSSIACSADGTKLFICAGGEAPPNDGISRNPSLIYFSTNGGLDWTQTGAPTNRWSKIASSADGTKLIAIAGNLTSFNGVYTSRDGGINWISNDITTPRWSSVASSADGSKLYGIIPSFNQLYTTTNSGTTWDSNAVPNGITWIACSADGTKLAAASPSPGYIFTSTNSGISWTTNNPYPSTWVSVALSADGNVLAAVDGRGGPSGHIFTSTNFGMTWFSNDVPLLSWQNIAVSSDGTRMIAAAWYSSGKTTGPVYTSTNSGATWISNNFPNIFWTGVACSADGAKLVAISAGTNNAYEVGVPGNGSVWVSQTTVPPKLNIASTNGLELSWIIPSTDFVLQQSDDLISWADVTNAPVLNLTNLQNQVTLEPSASPAFYRLKTP